MKVTVNELAETFTPYENNPIDFVIRMCAQHAHQLLQYREPVVDDNSDADRLKRLALNKGEDHALMICRAEIQKGMLSLSDFVEFVKWLQGIQAV